MPPPQKLLDAAVGYLYLGLVDEAWEELDSLPPEIRATAPVLEMRIVIYQKLGKWASARIIAESMAAKMPGNQNWWIQWAFCLRREKSVQEARNVLWQAVQFHPASAAIIYNLACYACVLGEIDEAKRQLMKAFALYPDFKLVALDDPDLAAIYRENSAP